ncbi:hypothetical protein DPMN_001588 [Dreissena polymorpha]|uniref:Uncharacterized protein n=1 Tax=Dreissena polymorpha TaxID=45954 RepID=A0A9D4RT69_DREPO|nr:hypothetical protein DPMN_001588 [Dreissena polymorpha]
MCFFTNAGIDGVNQWAKVSSGAPSNRTEFVYNIDEIERNAAIRYVTVYNIVKIKAHATITCQAVCNINGIDNIAAFGM